MNVLSPFHQSQNLSAKHTGVLPQFAASQVSFGRKKPPANEIPLWEQLAPPSEEVYVSGSKNQTIKLRTWRPAGKSFDDLPQKAPVVLLVHSLGGRSDWMTPLLKRLMEKNPQFRYYGLDIPYVGQHDYGLGHVKNPDDLVLQVKDAINHVAKTHEQEVYTVGLSLGGLLVTLAAGDKPNTQLAGTVALSPGYLPSGRIVNPKIVGKTAWSSLLGLFKKKHSNGIDFSAAGVTTDKHKKKPEDPNDLKRSELQQMIRKQKSLGEGKIHGLTIRSYFRLLKLMTRLYTKGAKKVEVPFRLYLSEADTVVSVKWAEEKIFPKIKSNDKGIIVYNESEHDFNTHPDIDYVSSSINHFLEQQHRVNEEKRAVTMQQAEKENQPKLPLEEGE